MAANGAVVLGDGVCVWCVRVLVSFEFGLSAPKRSILPQIQLKQWWKRLEGLQGGWRETYYLNRVSRQLAPFILMAGRGSSVYQRLQNGPSAGAIKSSIQL